MLTFLAGVLVTSFVFIMWGPKNMGMLRKARTKLKSGIESAGDSITDAFDGD